ncbi:hypothetical protein KUTeg_021577 [Tegillarca granosa]|uniref:Uncharacterized protein n=1 Tax=Tegillarca granosa TaxID=220873 RepID=A0ABQ9E9T0_TEGGR|nr:hypothetical protein KUTeg_021577 [Tegillarca granosa]
MANFATYVFHLLTKSRRNSDISKEEATRIWGKVTRELLKVFNKYEDGKDRLPISKLREACNQLHLYPSNSQVFEMVQCAVEYGSPCEPDHITFGEFCVLVTELQNHYAKISRHPVPKSLHRERTLSNESRRWKRRESMPNFEVFLGGSCNPTLWRQDIAIPFFKEHEITFYNPQVQNWRPELMELEDQAKQNADVLFFVIDNVTRAIASMIETAYLVGNFELNDLRRARKILVDLIERNSVPVFNTIESALKCTDIILKQNLTVQELTVEHGARPVLHGYLKVGEALLQMREAFNSIDNTKAGTLSAADEEPLLDRVVNSVRWFMDSKYTNITVMYICQVNLDLLKKHGLSYFNPCGDDWEQRLIPIQVSAREKCRLLLYIITNRTTSISSMIEISEKGLKDYNRGRSYLMDLASREGIQLFEDIVEAVNCAISFLTDAV